MNKTYDYYGEQRMGFKYYHQSVLEYRMHNGNKLSKEINKFKELCTKTQSFNKNDKINLSLDNFKNFLSFIEEGFKNFSIYEKFYWDLFFNFMLRVKNIYSKTFTENPLTIDISTVKYSYMLKKVCIDKGKLINYKPLNILLNNDFIEWDYEDRKETKKWLNEVLNNIPEEIKDKIVKSFNTIRDDIINFRLNKKGDVIKQSDNFYYLCEDLQKYNKDNLSDFSLDKDIYDIVNVMINGYNFGVYKNDYSLINFYYNLIKQFIMRIQFLISLSNIPNNHIIIDKNSIKFSYIIKKGCIFNNNLKYENQIKIFIKNCEGINGWDDNDKQKVFKMIDNFNK